jgi:hypothetical protein
MRNDYLEEGLRFIMVQRWALAPSKRRAVARAAANGYFDMLAAELGQRSKAIFPTTPCCSVWPRLAA